MLKACSRFARRRTFCRTIPTTTKSREFSLRPAVTTLNEEETMIKDAARLWSENTLRPLVTEMDRDSKMSDSLITSLFENGLMGVELPEKWGGSQASFTSAIAVVEEIAKVDASVGVLCDIQNTLINNMFKFWASEALQEEWCPRLAKNTVGSFCLSEPSSGSDAFSLKTVAEESPDGSYYTINGSKSWISNAEHAGVFLVMANVDPSKGYRGITCFVVDANTDGIEVGKPEDKLGIKASSTCGLSFTDCKVPASHILGKKGLGYKYAIEILNEGRIGIGAQMVGLAQGAYEATMPYLFQREQFGSYIGDFQAMEQTYARLATEIECSRLLVYNAARLKEQGLPFVKEAAMAKLYCAEVGERTASACIELVGGVGFTKDLPLEKYYRDSKVGSIYEGTANIQLATIAKLLKADWK